MHTHNHDEIFDDIVKLLEATIHSILSYYCEEGATLIVGVSGGPDSMALLYLLNKHAAPHRLNLIAAHVNHQLRGEESERDQALVEKTCTALGIKLEIKRADVNELRREQKLSLEEAGRQARITFFHHLKEQYNAAYILLAHHRDDNIETMIFNMVRGAGLRGMAGIAMFTRGILRPLLDFSKEELLEYCRHYAIPYAKDTSNTNTIFTRNYIRHVVIPSLEKINPHFREMFHEKSFYFAEIDEVLTVAALDFIRKSCTITPTRITCAITPFKNLLPAYQKQVIRAIYEMFHGSTDKLSGEQIETFLDLIYKERSGTEKIMGNRLSLEISYGKAHFQREKQQEERSLGEEAIAIPLPGSLSYPGGRITTRIHVAPPKRKKKNAIYISQRTTGETGKNKFYIRGFRQGDRFNPAGMNGTKKVHDFLIDRKIPRADRKHIPIIVDEQGEIVAVGALRIANKYNPQLFEAPIIEIEIQER